MCGINIIRNCVLIWSSLPRLNQCSNIKLENGSCITAQAIWNVSKVDAVALSPGMKQLSQVHRTEAGEVQTQMRVACVIFANNKLTLNVSASGDLTNEK